MVPVCQLIGPLVSEVVANTQASQFTSRLPSGSAAAILLVGGGTYLLSPLAQSCAKACRSPLGFFARQGGKRSEPEVALRVGLAYGANCLGCCWPLMGMMALFALHDLGWMLAGTLFMALQKSAHIPLVLTKLTGFVFLALAGAIATGHAAFLSDFRLDHRYPSYCGSVDQP
jgi:predicted metal-binding membrane protein